MVTPNTPSVSLFPITPNMNPNSNPSRDALIHVVTNVLHFGVNSPAFEAITNDGIEDIYGLLMLHESDLSHLETSSRALHRHEQRMFVMFVRWRRHLEISLGRALSLDDWMHRTADEFNAFRTSVISDIANPVVQTPLGSAPSNFASTPTSFTSSGVKAPNLVAEFQRGIKLDETQYAEFKDERYWDQWHRGLIARARAHDISEVFNPHYEPSTPAERDLFKAKQAFAYSVLNRCVLTDVGKTFVRQHVHDYNAQAVYTKLLNYSKRSTSAKIAIEKLVDYVTTARLDATWRGTSVGFLRNWK